MGATVCLPSEGGGRFLRPQILYVEALISEAPFVKDEMAQASRGADGHWSVRRLEPLDKPERTKTPDRSTRGLCAWRGREGDYDGRRRRHRVVVGGRRRRPLEVLRDLLERAEPEWQAERAKVASTGWGAQLLAHQAADGSWPPGIYAKWQGTHYSLLLLRSLGISPDNDSAGRGQHCSCNRVCSKTAA
jgi:hypothetical protein